MRTLRAEERYLCGLTESIIYLCVLYILAFLLVTSMYIFVLCCFYTQHSFIYTFHISRVYVNENNCCFEIISNLIKGFRITELPYTLDPDTPIFNILSLPVSLLSSSHLLLLLLLHSLLAPSLLPSFLTIYLLMFLNHLRVGCRHFASLSLNTSLSVS